MKIGCKQNIFFFLKTAVTVEKADESSQSSVCMIKIQRRQQWNLRPTE